MQNNKIMTNSINYKTKGSKIGLIVGLVLLVIFIYNAYITQSSESFGYVIVFLPWHAFKFILPSILLGVFAGWVYGKLKK